MDVLKAMKNKLEVAADGVGGSDVEKKVKAATSLENWPATNTQLHELSALTSDYAAYKEIMPLIWKRMGEPARNWRTIYKVLVLLEHLLRYGSPRVVEESRDRAFSIRQLQDFHFNDEGKDRGSGIREKATLIVDLLKDDAQLQEVRRTASQNLHKFTGISNSGEQRGASKWGGGGSDTGFGGGSGAFSGSSSGAYDDGFVSKADREREQARKSAKGDAPASSPYDDASGAGDDAAGEKKAKKKKKSKEVDEDEAKDPYADPNASAADTGSKKKKKKKSKDIEGTAAAEEEVSAAEGKTKRKKDKKAAATAIAGPPGAAGADDDFGEFSAAPFTSAAGSSQQPPQQARAEELSFDTFAGSSSTAAPPAKPAPTGDLIDMFASQSIDGGWGNGGSSSSHAQRGGEIDLMSGVTAPPKAVATPNLFDSTSSSASKAKSPSAAKSPAVPAFDVNDHNNTDAFSAFVAGHKPAPAAAAGSKSSAPAAAAPAKKGELAWDNSLVNLGGLTSAKAPAPGSAPAPFIPLAKGAAGSTHDPFSHLGGAAQQQQRQQMQMQRPGGFGGPQQQGGMNSGFPGGMMGGGGGMGGGFGGMQPGGMQGGGFGMQQPMGFGAPNMGGGMGMGIGFPPPKKADPNQIFF